MWHVSSVETKEEAIMWLSYARPMIVFIMSCMGVLGLWVSAAHAQLIDQTQAPNTAHRGIALSLTEQIGGGQGEEDWTPGSSLYLITRDPARAIRRGRQIFQRKFTIEQGLGPRKHDGIGDITTDLALGAGLVDSCAGCHGRPRGSGGVGGNVVTRPDSRDAPHLFGLGLKEMLADEITHDLRALRAQALATAQQRGQPVTQPLHSKGIQYGALTAFPDDHVDTSTVVGVNPDLRVRPFFAHGGTISIREFIVGALKNEMGLETYDPCLLTASHQGTCVTPAGMVLDSTQDAIETPPVSSPTEDGDGDGVVNEIDAALIDYLEFYLVNYFKPGLGQQTVATAQGFRLLEQVGCTTCHIRDLAMHHDRRVADVETYFDPQRGIFNRLFAEVATKVVVVPDGQPLPKLLPAGGAFVVHNIFTDLKRHNLGPAFYELNYDGTFQQEFMTTPLWGVGSTAPYGHDGRSINLLEVILRHGGEAQLARDQFAALPHVQQRWILEALESLILFPPDDTASNLDPGDPSDPHFPQSGHGSIKLGVLFTTPGPE
jgi:hypothetical protein